MKKILISLFLFVAIASFGGYILPVHADTLTPAQAAALQQSLDALKVKLSDLQAQAAAQAVTITAAPAPVAVSNSASLSNEDAATLKTELSALASALRSLQIQFGANPAMAKGHEAAVLAMLQGVSKTLVMVNTMISPAQAMAAAPVAAAPIAMQAAPSVTVTANPSPAPVAMSASVPANPNQAQVTPTAAAPVETAAVASSWSWKQMNWPLVIVVILVLLAVGLWLFWPTAEEDTKKTVTKSATLPMAPSPVKTVPQPQTSFSTQMAPEPKAPIAQQQPPLQQQQRKPA